VSGATASARLRVLFAPPYLAKDGGSERVMVTLLTHLDRQRFEPMLVVQDAARNEIAHPLPADVPVVDLGLARARRAWWPPVALVRRHRQCRVRPDRLPVERNSAPCRSSRAQTCGDSSQGEYVAPLA